MTAYLILIVFFISSLSSQVLIEKKLKKMSLDEKIGQMLMPSFQGEFQSENDQNYKDMMWFLNRFHVGGLILFRGNAYATAFQLNELQKRSKLPLLVSSDFERGVFQQQDDGIHFPSNMAIAATGEVNYAYEQGKITAIEARSIGVHMILAPVLDINNNPKNPIINYRSYGENPQLVARFGSEFIRGIQDHHAIATAKHFPGHGDTAFDSHIGLPIIDLDMSRLDSVEFVPFKAAASQNVGAFMTAHIALPKLNNGCLIPATSSKKLLRTILRKRWKYKGLVISDAFNMKAVNMEGMSGTTIIQTVQSGVDIFLMPMSLAFTFRTIKKAIRDKKISIRRINESVRRILKAKYKLGLFKNRQVKLSKLKRLIEQKEFKKTASKIARDAITWIRNEDFPERISYKRKILNISVSSERSLENPGQSFFRQIKKSFPNAKRQIIDYRTDSLLLPKLEKSVEDSELIIVSLFSRTRGGKKRLGIQIREEKMLRSLLKNVSIPIVFVSFGSPYIASDFADFPNHLAAFSYSKLMQVSAALAIADQSQIRGQMPVHVPYLNDENGTIFSQLRVKKFQGQKVYDTEKIDALFKKAIQDSVFPGAAMLVGTGDEILFKKAFGHFRYDPNSPKVKINTMYDIASLTKIMATTLSIMKLIDRAKLSLKSKLGDVLNEYAGSEKENITIEQLLTHSSGMLWHKNYFETIKNKQDIFDAIYKEKLVTKPGEQTKYSDLGFITLMQIVERLTGKSLDEFVKLNFYEKMNLKNIVYRPKEKNKIPPTEAVEWRGHLAQGEVHDENAMAMGAVSGHAGLFADVESLGAICQMILRKGEYKGHRFLSKRIVEKFGKRANVDPKSNRALGWDKPSPISMAGKYFSDESFGHSGFTGTTVWIDPKQEVFVILLSNRVYPSRKNRKISKFRPKFHNLVMECFGYTELRESYKKYLGLD